MPDDSLDNFLARYDYVFPKSAIAQAPAKPRDSAKLLVYRHGNGETKHDTFKNLGNYLPDNAVVVFNQTKVIPARLALTKPTGGKVRVLYLAIENNLVRVLADRKLEPGSRLTLTKKISFGVVRHEEKYYYLRPDFPIAKVAAVFEKYGTAPIPPYIRETPLKPAALKAQYQTVFAKQRGSVAAPTASLHFTKRLLADLKRRGITIVFVTLHVGLGTFAPITEAQLRARTLHHERYEVSTAAAKTLNAAKQKGRPIIAVGTTVARTLESAAAASGKITRLSGATDLFIQEGYRFKFVDGLITNFHVPKSSLLMLVAALAGREPILHLYKEAIRKGYRLFSFGDGMLIL